MTRHIHLIVIWYWAFAFDPLLGLAELLMKCAMWAKGQTATKVVRMLEIAT